MSHADNSPSFEDAMLIDYIRSMRKDRQEKLKSDEIKARKLSQKK